MKKIVYRVIKRSIDIALATIGFLICIPVYCIISVMIKFTSKGKVLYQQKRCGKDGKVFNIYKFRTMVEGSENIERLPQNLQEEYKTNYKIIDDPRTTKVGSTLRKWINCKSK